MVKIKKNYFLQILIFLTFITIFPSCKVAKGKFNPTEVITSKPIITNYKVRGSLTKKLILNVDNPGEYAGLSVFADDELILDDFNLPKAGNQTLIGVVNFRKHGEVKIRFQSLDENLKINSYHFEDLPNLIIPAFKDISEQIGLDKVSSLKYGGPSIADIDNDGDYDFIVNNHNAETSKLYWNNGNGTVTKHNKDLARWFKHDLHGTALGDFDNDRDLDLILTQGGGNGKNPSKVNFFLNDEKKLIRYTGDVGIDKGGRGRGAKWLDMDLDGDLDLLIINEASLNFDKPQHFFYENKGNRTLKYKAVKHIENLEESRALITDFNNDNIDDLIFYSPISLWKGNGDFTFKDVSYLVPEHIRALKQIMAIADIDIDNDGDLDLYLAQGMHFEHGKGESPSLDFNPITKELSLKTRGYEGTDAFDFTSEGNIKIQKYYYLAQGSFLGEDYPVYVGEDKIPIIIKSGDELEVNSEMAKGWPDDISNNGFYLGYIGNNQWKATLVRSGNFFWQYRFSLSGVSGVSPKFIPQNRNKPDFLIRNDGNNFTDISKKWNIPEGGNALGVTTGDFNNDGYQDLFVYRWGRIGARISDLMLLNTGNNNFQTITMHGANDVGGPGNGDMGQAFDFNLDGQIDLLNGSEGGEWYLYSNQTKSQNNHLTVKVGYSPKSNIDPLSAVVDVETAANKYRKRVGSSGSIFSQSLMNIIHFGLAEEKEITRIKIRWRNGETVEFKNKLANKIIDTDKLDPKVLSIKPLTIREGTKASLKLSFLPENSNKDVSWSSSDKNVLTVDQRGNVSAIGKPNQEAIITATSKANGISTSTNVQIVEWTPIPVKSISIKQEKTTLYSGQRSKVTSTIFPEDADNSELYWKSNNTDVITIDECGNINAIAPGKTTIQLFTTDKTVSSEVQLYVEPYSEPHIKIVDKVKYENQSFIVGQDLKVLASYHAGSGESVISADEGGIRFWLRHFKSKWIPVNDIILTDVNALDKESGNSIMTFSLAGVVPTKELPKGHFYQLRVTFTSSDGNMYEDSILPLEIVQAVKNKSPQRKFVD